MQLLRTVALGAVAMASYVTAQAGNLQFLSVPTSVQAGQPATITYSGGNGVSAIETDGATARRFPTLTSGDMCV